MAGPDPLTLLHAPRWPDAAPAIAVGDVAAAAAGGAGLAIAIALAVALRRRPRSDPRQTALAAVAEAGALPPGERLARLAAAARRFLHAVRGPEAAEAQGEAFLERLDAVFRTTAFTAGPGRALTEELYRPTTAEAADAAGILLAERLRRWRH